MKKKNLVLQVFIAFIAGLILGVVLWLAKVDISGYVKIVSPFGQVLVAMLKMLVIPVIFLSLIGFRRSTTSCLEKSYKHTKHF